MTWTAPTTRVDGAPLTLGEIGGFRVYYGTTPDPVTNVVNVPGSGATRHQVTGLASGTHYFRVSTYDSDGVEGPKTAVASKIIP